MGKSTTTNKCKRVPDLWRPVKIKRYYAKNGRLIPTTKRGKEIKQQWNYNKYNIFARYFGLKNKPSTGSKRKWMPIWAMKSHMLGADQFIEFISLPMTGMRRETKLIRNAGIQIKWLMKNHMLRADQFIEFIFTCDRNVTWNEVHLNCRNTDEMWWCDFRVRICNCLNCDYNCDDHIFISTVYFVFQGIFRSCLWSVFSL